MLLFYRNWCQTWRSTGRILQGWTV